MKKFVRSSEHKKISDIDVNHSTEYTKESLEMLKTAIKVAQNVAETRKEEGAQVVNFENIQMASSSEESDITIDNAHHKHF